MSDVEKALRALVSDRRDSADSKELIGALAKLVNESQQRDYDPAGAKKLEPLREALDIFRLEHTFEVGDIVRWKNGMKNRRKPAYGEPAIVIEFDRNISVRLNDKGPETPYFREPLNLQLGLLDDDGDFVVYHFDSRRFEPWAN